ncbi:MAG: YeeE/YedE family protein [Sedimentisphaerales bacterium]|nr:YeeE/YedE family protein [Sedimentisphaerales bacterium]
MSPTILGLIIGFIFGAALILAGLADPDKIIGTLRLKDFHAMRTIAVFVIVSMLGYWLLDLLGYAHGSVKAAVIIPVIIGGVLLGVGFGMTGFCPGTGLACAAAGRIDAIVATAGMLLGALAYILLYPFIVPAMEGVWNYGKVTLPEITPISRTIYTIAIAGFGIIILFLTRPRAKTV